MDFFRTASETFYGNTNTPGLLSAQQHLLDSAADFGPTSSQNPLLNKQAIIVLREELEYFSIPPNDGKPLTDSSGIANEFLLDIKKRSGDYLIARKNIFTALQRNVNKENNVAEQHLIDMLCMRSVNPSSVQKQVTDRGWVLQLTVDSTEMTNGVSVRLSPQDAVFPQ